MIKVVEQSYCATKVRWIYQMGQSGKVLSKINFRKSRGDLGFLIPYLFPEFGSYDANKADLEQS